MTTTLDIPDKPDYHDGNDLFPPFDTDVTPSDYERQELNRAWRNIDNILRRTARLSVEMLTSFHEGLTAAGAETLAHKAAELAGAMAEYQTLRQGVRHRHALTRTGAS